jgi:hypothetical protein
MDDNPTRSFPVINAASPFHFVLYKKISTPLFHDPLDALDDPLIIARQIHAPGTEGTGKKTDMGRDPLITLGPVAKPQNYDFHSTAPVSLV